MHSACFAIVKHLKCNYSGIYYCSGIQHKAKAKTTQKLLLSYARQFFWIIIPHMIFHGSHCVLWQKTMSGNYANHLSHKVHTICLLNVVKQYIFSPYCRQHSFKSPWNFSHATTAVLLGHVQNLMVIMSVIFKLKGTQYIQILVSVVKSPVSQAQAVVNQIRPTVATLSCQIEVIGHKCWSCTNLSLQIFLFSID